MMAVVNASNPYEVAFSWMFDALHRLGLRESSKPASRRSRNRWRHLPTVWWVTPSPCATAVLGLPLAHSNTIRARWAKACALFGRRAQRSSTPHAHHSAKAWELRATMSLAALLAKNGRRDEARAMLAEIYGWFTAWLPYSDTKDVKSATRGTSQVLTKSFLQHCLAHRLDDLARERLQRRAIVHDRLDRDLPDARLLHRANRIDDLLARAG